MTFNVRILRDGTITCSALALALACATGTLEDVEGDGNAGRGTAGTPNPTGGSAGSSGGVGGGQAGSGLGAGTGGKAVTGGTGGATGGTSGGTLGGGAGGTGGSVNNGGSAGSLGTGGAQGQGGSSGGTPGTGGSPASGGSAGMPVGSGGGAGKGGAGGSSGATGGKGGTGSTAGSGGGAGMPSTACSEWPTANGSQSVSSTIAVNGTYDGQFKRFSGSGALGSGGQQENQDPLFEVANGGTLKNVIIGNPASDGVHCEGSCTLENVWWEDVGEDAATFRGSGNVQMTVRCGGAKNAMDKIFQHNGGGTLTIEDFQVDGFSKLYRSCGNCSTQLARHVVVRDVTARSGSTLVGINTNYGDSATFERVTVYGNITICERYTGNNNGGEPVRTGSGPDSQYCLYEASDIIQR